MRGFLPSREALDFTKFLLRDGIARYPSGVIGMTALGIVATLLQVTLLGLLFAIFSSGATGTLKLSIFRWKATIPMGTDAVLSSAILVSLSLGLVAWIVFTVRKLSESLCRKYQMFCVERALHHMLTAKHLEVSGDEAAAERELSRIARTDSRYTGLCFGRLLYLPVPLISFTVYFTVLVCLNPQLTAIIVLLIPMAFAFQMFIIRKAGIASNELERLAPEVSKEIAALLAARSKSTAGMADTQKFLAKTLHEGDMREFVAARSTLMLLPDRSQMVNEVFAAAAIAAVIYTFAFGVGFKVARLTEIIHYLAMLRMLSGAAKQISSLTTSMNRYMPQAVRYFRFLQGLHEAESDTTALPGRAGLHALALDVDLHRYNISGILHRVGNVLEDPPLAARPALVSLEPLNLGAAGLRDMLVIPEGQSIQGTWEACWGEAPGWIRESELETWTCADALARLSKPQLLTLAIAATLASNPTSLLIYEKDLQKLPKEEIRHLLSVNTKLTVLLVHDLPYRGIGQYEEETLVELSNEHDSEHLPIGRYLEERKHRQHELTEKRLEARKKIKSHEEEEDE